MDWQPIETAPLDGSRVKLGGQKLGSGPVVESKAVSWTFANGRWLGNYQKAGYRSIPCPFTPTHWKPTP